MKTERRARKSTVLKPQCHSVKRNLSFRGSDRCHCRGNPYSKRQRKRIAAPVCGLARNDKALNLMALAEAPSR